MGSPNFSYDRFLNETFGDASSDHAAGYIESLKKRLATTKSHLFTPKISLGYHDGFVIHTASRIDDRLSHHDELPQLTDILESEAMAVLSDYLNYDKLLIKRMSQEDTKTAESDYILDLMSIIADQLSAMGLGGIERYSHLLVSAMSERGVKFSDYDADDDDSIEQLKDDIQDAIYPKAIIKAVNDYIDDDLAKLDDDICTIAKDYGLKPLIGNGYGIRIDTSSH